MRRFAICVGVVGIWLAVAAVDGGAYYDKAHEAAAEKAIDLLRRSDEKRVYAEIYSRDTPFETAVRHGSTAEDYGAVDGNERSFRHYYDPTVGRGVDWFTYFNAWPALIPGCKVRKPEAGYFPGALQWAQNGADTLDKRNWKGAVEAYGYTLSSRREAYWRLGHVIHLLTDMAEPDHATNTPHAASGYRLPRDAKMIMELLPWKSLWKEHREQFENLVALYEASGKSVVGYELFVEEFLPDLQGRSIVRHPNLKAAFDELAHLSREALRKGDVALPVGIRFWPGSEQHWPGEDVFWPEEARFSSKKNYSFIPAIEISDEDERRKYKQLAEDLLNHATDRCAGVLALYFDAVTPPPYVKRVTVTQEGQVRYEAKWVDRSRTVAGVHDGADPKYTHHYRYEVVDGRRLVRTRTSPIQSGQVARITVEFGPSAPGPGAAAVRMDGKTVLVRVHERYVDMKPAADGRTWTGTFTHTLSGDKREERAKIHIAASDAGPHLTAEDGGGIFLDGEPDTPARATCPVPGSPPTFLGYEMGYDEHHEVRVRDLIDPEIPHVRCGVGVDVAATVNDSEHGEMQTHRSFGVEARGHFTGDTFTGIIDSHDGRKHQTGSLTATVDLQTGELKSLEVTASIVLAVVSKGDGKGTTGHQRVVSAKLRSIPYSLCWHRVGPTPPGKHEMYRPGWHSWKLRGPKAKASIVSFASSEATLYPAGWKHEGAPKAEQVTKWHADEKSEVVVSFGTN